MFYVSQQGSMHNSLIKYSSFVQPNQQYISRPRSFVQYLGSNIYEEKLYSREKLETTNSLHSFDKPISRTNSTNIDPDELVKLIKHNWLIKGQINELTEEVENLKENISQLKSLLEAMQEQPITKSARKRYQNMQK